MTCLCIPLHYFSDLEWKIIYVGSAESVDHDQTLDSVLVGPVPGGKHMFVFQVRIYINEMLPWNTTTLKII